MSETLIVHTDGGSRGNPGPGAAAYVLKDSRGKILDGQGLFLGDVTNNLAEYTAVLRGLQAARQTGATSVLLRSDSELIVRQINGQYKVKNATLRQYYEQCMEELEKWQRWDVVHVRREKNAQADRLANQAMDARKNVSLPGGKGKDNAKTNRPPVRLGILLSGGGRTMLNIQEQIDAAKLNAKIVCVISSRSAVKGVERARNIGLQPQIVRKKDYPDVEDFSAKITEALQKAKVDLVVQAGWLCLWKIPKVYENRVMNIHPALLPSFGGRGMWGHHVHEAVLEKGCKVSGCTVHFCTNEYDEGPIIVQRCCEVCENDDADTLADRVFEQECIAYPQAIRWFGEGRLLVESGRVRIGATEVKS